MDASSDWYHFQIDEGVLLPYGFGTLDDDLNFKGSIVATTDIEKPVINEIAAYYDAAPLGFEIKVVAVER